MKREEIVKALRWVLKTERYFFRLTLKDGQVFEWCDVFFDHDSDMYKAYVSKTGQREIFKVDDVEEILY